MKSAFALGIALGLVGFLPLLGGPRYESALIAGILAPLWASITAFRSLVRRYLVHRMADPSRVESWIIGGAKTAIAALRIATWHCVSILVVATLHGLREGFCEPWLGYSTILLGPCFGVVLASLSASLGASLLLGFAGARSSSQSLIWTAWGAPFLLILGSVAIRLWVFYSSPMVFAYDPFVGYVAGPLYDRVEYDLLRFLSFRLGTLFTIGALLALILAFQFKSKREAGLLRVSRWEPVPHVTLLLSFALVAQAGSVIHSVRSDMLGHTQSTRSIRIGLGRQLENQRCRVFFSNGVGVESARLLAAECVGHLHQIERYFNAQGRTRVDIYLFSSSSEKRYYMGAANTYIAKPWRKEIYLQPSEFPHPVLGHELAHVVAGQFGQGPLAIAGTLGGLIPDPGRIEGFAVAASPREHSDGTLHEWTAAMLEQGRLPPLQKLFQLSFLENSAIRSYTAAGSFVDFLKETRGSGVLRRWYGGSELEGLTGTSWGALESQWHSFLQRVQVPHMVKEAAKPRFSRPGIFERRCPHAVDRAVSATFAYCPVQEKKARAAAQRAIELDPLRADLRMELASCTLQSEKKEAALNEWTRELQRVEMYSPGALRRGFTALGDAHFSGKRRVDAKAAYGEALSLSYSSGVRRQLEVKLWAMDQKPEIEAPLRLLLAPGPEAPEDATLSLAKWYAKADAKSFPAYLLSRNSFAAGRLGEAAAYLEEVRLSELPLRSLQQETLRSRVLIECRKRMLGGSLRPLTLALQRYRRFQPGAAATLEAERLSERCSESGLRGQPTSTNLGP